MLDAEDNNKGQETEQQSERNEICKADVGTFSRRGWRLVTGVIIHRPCTIALFPEADKSYHAAFGIIDRMPRKSLSFVLAVILGFLLMSVFPQIARSDELDDINKQINDLTSQLNQSVAATKPLESQLTSMQSQINGIKAKVSAIDADIITKKKTIDEGYKSLEKKQALLNQTIRQYYIKSYYNSPLLILLSSDSASDVTQIMAYQRAAANRDKSMIAGMALSITSLEERRRQLQSEQTRLITVKQNLDVQSKKLDDVIQGAKTYQRELSGKLADLSSRQQEIVNSRSGGFTATLGDSDQADDYNASIKGFRESAPSGSFAMFSFGAHTHRKGMSQYGARGRAQAGQDWKAILKAYYQKDPSGADTGGSIKVAGYGELDFETTYLYGIAEMPSSWHPEALKAQAVAARTYAYRYKKDGKEICTTEACQVFNKSKSDNAPQSWKDAVNGTKGQILEDVTTYYASTHGGFASPIGWDTTDGAGGGNFIDKAYDKLGGSPWVYKAWYTKGYSSSSDKCGRSSPWLNGTEMADIINAVITLNGGGSGDETGRITPVTTSCWGGNPYSMDELRSVSGKYGGGVSSVSSVSVLQGNGNTNEVVFSTDKGEKRFNGSTFKTGFNLRAPGYLSIPQSGFAFFNIEKK
jgi:peptidoglycan hydrolase CwlO-like protein